MSKSVDIPLPGMVMVHDMSLTRSYAVVYDLPVTVDLDLAGARRFPYRWNPDYTPRVGLLPRSSTDAADIIWCAIEPCYAYHPMNAYDADDGTVVIDICRYDRMFDRDILGPAGDSRPACTAGPSTQRAARSARSVSTSGPWSSPRRPVGVGEPAPVRLRRRCRRRLRSRRHLQVRHGQGHRGRALPRGRARLG